MALVYNCCFWFSVRLGAVLVGLFSLIQAAMFLVLSCLAYTHQQFVKDTVSEWIENMQLIFTKRHFEDFVMDPEKYIKWSISLTCIYIILCIIFIYGAFTCATLLLVGFILAELARLAALSLLLVTWLLILKKNTMDIGLLIGASVGFGFVLLGMFYLWVCAASLPILINEMEKDEQAATIAKLRHAIGEPRYARQVDDEDYYNPTLFTVARSRNHYNKIIN